MDLINLICLVAFIFLCGLLPYWLYKSIRSAIRFNKQVNINRYDHKGMMEKKLQILNYFKEKFPYLLDAAISPDEQKLFINQSFDPRTFHDEIKKRIAGLRGVKLGSQRFHEYRFEVNVPIQQFQKHTYVIGKTGIGKTTLLNNVSKQLIESGSGLAIFAYEADMINDVIMMIPQGRENDFIYVNPLDTEKPVTYNPFHINEGENIALKNSDVFTVFNRFFDASNMPRTEAILKNMISTLVRIPGTSMMDIEPFLDNAGYRNGIINKINDDRLRYFWHNKYLSFPKNSDQPIVNRVDRFIGDSDSPCRNIFCSSGNSLDFKRVIEENKIVLINLADSLIGEENAKLIGQMLFAQFQISAMSRAEIEPGKRKPFFLILDEFQRLLYGSSIETIEQLLSRARKYGFCLLMANQQTGQLESQILDAILGNVGMLISFGLSRKDADRISKEMNVWKEGELMRLPSELIQELQIGETFTRIGNNSFFMSTPRFDRKWDNEKIDRLEELSRDQYGVKPLTDHIRIISQKEICLNELKLEEMDVYQ